MHRPELEININWRKHKPVILTHVQRPKILNKPQMNITNQSEILSFQGNSSNLVHTADIVLQVRRQIHDIFKEFPTFSYRLMPNVFICEEIGLKD